MTILILIRQGLRRQKRNDKEIFLNSLSKLGATEEEGGHYHLGLLKRGVKRSVILLVNQTLNPRSVFPSPCLHHLAMCHQSATSFPALSQPPFCFSWITGYSSASCGVWQVCFIFARHSRCLSSP